MIRFAAGSLGIRLTLLVFIMTCRSVQAAWMENLPIRVTNPDGSVIECFVSGDEFFNYLHDAAGHTIVAGDDGYHYYAVNDGDTLKASPYRVGLVTPKDAGIIPGRRISEKEYYKRRDDMFFVPEDTDSVIVSDSQTAEKEIDELLENAPHSGVMNNIVIYVRFSDDDEFTSPRSFFDSLFNGETGSSVKEYFEEVSYGKITVQSHHYPPAAMSTNLSYQDQYPRSYFQPYNTTTNPDGYTSSERGTRERQLVNRAITAVADMIPEDMVVDGDGDGRVDNVAIIVKGGTGPFGSILWAHRWALISPQTYINGKRVYDYTFQPQTQSTVQTLSHELFHTFGAPDLYRYTAGITPVGPWDIMHSGSGHMGAYMKWKYTNNTWIEDIPVISDPGTYTLNPLTSPTNNAFRINSPNSDTEFFVVEYRKKDPDTYDRTIPGSGLLVYRINSLKRGNTSGPPDEVYVYRPNGTNTLNGIVYKANYSLETERVTINDTTNPCSYLSDGSAGGLDISIVSQAGATISFNLFGGTSQSYAITVGSDPVSGGSVSGGGSYWQGQSVTVSADAATNYAFTHWQENSTIVSTANPYTFIASKDRSLTARFEAAGTIYTITLIADPEKGGELTGAGNYLQGETVIVSTAQSEGHIFENWSENGSAVSTNTSYSFTAQSDRTLTAHYTVLTVELILTANPTEGCKRLLGAGTYDYGTVMSIRADTADGYTFVNWTEGSRIYTTQPNTILLLNSDRHFTANFSSGGTEPCTISATAEPLEGGTISGTGVFENTGDTEAVLTAVPASGYSFLNWTENGSVVSEDPIYAFIVAGNHSITAHFEASTYTMRIYRENPSVAGQEFRRMPFYSSDASRFPDFLELIDVKGRLLHGISRDIPTNEKPYGFYIVRKSMSVSAAGN